MQRSRKRHISDFVFCVIQAIRSKRTQAVFEFRLLSLSGQFDFASIHATVSSNYSPLQAVVIREAMGAKLSTYQLLDIQRFIAVCCPCQTQEDWDYLNYLLTTYYP